MKRWRRLLAATLAIVALSATMVMSLNTGIAFATADTGIHPTCKDGDLGDDQKPQSCAQNDDFNCTLRAWNPTVAHEFQNDILRVHSAVNCDNGQDAMKVGASVLYRYDCTRATLQWHCDPSSGTTVGDSFQTKYCGYMPTHNDAASCQVVGTGYLGVGQTWEYDVKDKENAQSCHAFQQKLNGSHTTPNGVVHFFHESDSWGTLYGKGTTIGGVSFACSGTIGNFVG